MEGGHPAHHYGGRHGSRRCDFITEMAYLLTRMSAMPIPYDALAVCRLQSGDGMLSLTEVGPKHAD
jgi:hypothetical protein